MSRNSARTRNARGRGFSLLEAVVSLLVLVVIMVLALSLLFSMRSLAERQVAKTAPRQTSRQAIDYLSYFVGGASDLNQGGTANNPNAIVTYWADGNGNVRQASYNNLTSAQEGAGLGLAGTDVVSLAIPVNPTPIRASIWGGFASTATTSLDYGLGCAGGNTANNDLFKQVTGAHVDGAFGGATVSDLLMGMNATGNWGYYRITQYDASPDCTRAGAAIQIVSNPARNVQVNNPAGQPSLADPVTLVAGVRFVSFRVRQDANGNLNLEQKQGIFDPTTDTPGTDFIPVVEDVEDLQIAWLYNQPPAGGATIFNSTGQTLVGAGVSAGVPPQGGQGGNAAYDVTRVAGLRVTVVARSKPLRFTSLKLTQRTSAGRLNQRPAVEDHTAGPIDGFDHQRITSTLMIRNRMLGN